MFLKLLTSTEVCVCGCVCVVVGYLLNTEYQNAHIARSMRTNLGSEGILAAPHSFKKLE